MVKYGDKPVLSVHQDLSDAPLTNKVKKQFITDIRLKHEEIENYNRFPFSLNIVKHLATFCLLYTSPSPRDA